MEILGREIRLRGSLIRIGFLDGEGYQFLGDPRRALEVLQKSDTGIDLFTFIEKLSEPTPKFSYPMEWDNMAALPITTFDDWIKNQIDFKVRNKLRKATKHGVVVREVPFDDALIQGISRIYNESPIRQGRRFWHYGKDSESLRRMKSSFLDRSIFIGAFLQGSLIGFIKLVADEDRKQAGLMHVLSMLQHRDKAPTNALIAQAVRSCAERRIPYLWYANFSYGRRRTDSLAEFKRHNGFQKIDLPRYYVPLTFRGRLGLSLGLHRDLVDWIPEPVIVKYRSIRSRWYAKRFHSLENF